MSTLKFTHKRGDSFEIQGVVSINGVVQDITNWIIASEIRKGNDLVARLTVTKVEPTQGTFRLSDADTTSWPISMLDCDIQYTQPNGQIVSTDTFQISVKKDVTA